MLAGLPRVALQVHACARIRPPPPGRRGRRRAAPSSRRRSCGPRAAGSGRRGAGCRLRCAASPAARSRRARSSRRSRCSGAAAARPTGRGSAAGAAPSSARRSRELRLPTVWPICSSRVRVCRSVSPRRRTSSSIFSWPLAIRSASALISAWRLSSVASAVLASTLRASSLTRSRSGTLRDRLRGRLLDRRAEIGLARRLLAPREQRRRRAPRRGARRLLRARRSRPPMVTTHQTRRSNRSMPHTTLDGLDYVALRQQDVVLGGGAVGADGELAGLGAGDAGGGDRVDAGRAVRPGRCRGCWRRPVRSWRLRARAPPGGSRSRSGWR